MSNKYWTIGIITEICYKENGIFFQIRSIQEMSAKIENNYYNIFLLKNEENKDFNKNISNETCIESFLVNLSKKFLISNDDKLFYLLKNAFDHNKKVKIVVEKNKDKSCDNNIKLKEICLIGEKI